MPELGAASPATPPRLNESLVSEMTQAALSTKNLTLEHHIDYEVPAPFPTARPCRLLVQGERFKRKLGKDSVEPFASALGFSRLLEDAREFRGPPCRGDSTRTDVAIVTFGKGKNEVRALVDLGSGTTTFSWRDSTPAVVSLGKHSEDLRRLLMTSLPEDSLIRGIRLCDRTAPESLDVAILAKVRGYVWVESLPEAIERVAPVYPEPARLKGVSGVVMVQALVSKMGAVTSTRIVHSIPSLDEAAIRAVEGWRFRPAMADGAPLAVWVAIPVKFRLR